MRAELAHIVMSEQMDSAAQISHGMPPKPMALNAADFLPSPYLCSGTQRCLAQLLLSSHSTSHLQLPPGNTWRTTSCPSGRTPAAAAPQHPTPLSATHPRAWHGTASGAHCATLAMQCSLPHSWVSTAGMAPHTCAGCGASCATSQVPAQTGRTSLGTGSTSLSAHTIGSRHALPSTLSHVA